MRKLLASAMVLLALCAGCKGPKRTEGPRRPEEPAAGAARKPPGRRRTLPGALRHLVLLKLKDDATQKEIRAVEDGFRSLPNQIPQVLAFEWGRDVNGAKRSEGFTHCFLVTFRSADGRDAYLPHPAHKEFVELLKPTMDKVLVLDYVLDTQPPLPNPHLGKLRHVVLFQFKETATAEQIRAVLAEGGAMKGKIPQILALEQGGDVSVEDLQQGFTHAVLVTFKDAAARDAYLPHPVHQALVKKLTPILERLLVVDYVAQK